MAGAWNFAVMTIDRMMLQNVWNELDYRLDVCRVTQGAHIEHLYNMQKTGWVYGSFHISIVFLHVVLWTI
jgi:hypothetical protein